MSIKFPPHYIKNKSLLGTSNISFFKKDFIYLFLERGEGRERTINVRGNINLLPLAHPQPGIWPATQACALPGNQTSDLSLCRTMPRPLSHTSQGQINPLRKHTCIYIYLKWYHEWTPCSGRRGDSSSHTCIRCPRTWGQASTVAGPGSGVMMANWRTEPQ